MGWVVKYTISSKYINQKQWEKYQRKVLSSYLKEVQFVIVKGQQNFLKIYFEIRRRFR